MSQMNSFSGLASFNCFFYVITTFWISLAAPFLRKVVFLGSITGFGCDVRRVVDFLMPAELGANGLTLEESDA